MSKLGCMIMGKELAENLLKLVYPSTELIKSYVDVAISSNHYGEFLESIYQSGNKMLFEVIVSL